MAEWEKDFPRYSPKNDKFAIYLFEISKQSCLAYVYPIFSHDSHILFKLKYFIFLSQLFKHTVYSLAAAKWVTKDIFYRRNSTTLLRHNICSCRLSMYTSNSFVFLSWYEREELFCFLSQKVLCIRCIHYHLTCNF